MTDTAAAPWTDPPPVPALHVAVRWCTYKGVVTLDQVGPFRGPTTMNELMWPVEAIYDATTNKTRIGWSYIAPTPQAREAAMSG